MTPAPRPAWRRARRAASRWRRPLAAGLAAAAVLLVATAVTPGDAAGAHAAVWTTTRDLTGGAALRQADVTLVTRPRGAVPDGALGAGDRVVGEVLAAPTRRGEALTDVRLVGREALRGYGADLVAAPVRLADRAVGSLLRPGDLVDVLAAAPPSEAWAAAGAPRAGAAPTAGHAPPATSAAPGELARTVASRVRVALVPSGGDAESGGDVGDDGALVLLAVDTTTAARLAHAAVTARLSLVLRAGGTPGRRAYATD